MIYVFIAYLLCGISMAIKDIKTNPEDAPGWTYKPTFGKLAFVILTWFYRPIMMASIFPGDPQRNRKIAFGLFASISPLVLFSFIVWGCWTLAALVTDSFFVHLFVALVLWCLALFLMPLRVFPLMLVQLIIAFPLGWLFPQPDTTKAVKSCGNCQHYKKTKVYEDVTRGLWRSKTMPQSDNLPCKITLETAEVWKAYFDLDPMDRAIFPKECPRFVMKAK